MELSDFCKLTTRDWAFKPFLTTMNDFQLAALDEVAEEFSPDAAMYLLLYLEQSDEVEVSIVRD